MAGASSETLSVRRSGKNLKSVTDLRHHAGQTDNPLQKPSV